MFRTILCLGLSFFAVGAEPDLSKPSPEQQENLKKRDALLRDVNELMKANKLKDALPVMERVLKLELTVFDETQKDVQESLHHLALLQEQTEDFASAELTWQHLLKLQTKTLGPDHWLTVESQLKAANAKRIAGSNAERREQEAEARKWNAEALTFRNRGQLKEAVVCAEKALQIRLKVLGENHPDSAASLNNLAAIYYADGQHARAEPLFQKAIAIIAAHLEESAVAQSETDQLAHAKSMRGYLDNLLWGTQKAKASATYEFVFRLRGAITVRQTFARAARESSPDVVKISQQLQECSRRIAFLTANPPNEPDIKSTEAIAKLHDLYESLQRQLAAKSAEFQKYRESKKLTPADLQRKLPKDAVLLDFLQYNDELCCFVITAKEIQRVELGKIEPISEAIDEFRRTMDRSRPVLNKEMDTAVILREKLLTPLRKPMGDANLLLISPDGPLCRLPFAALPGKEDSKYLIEEVSVAMMPVPRLLVELLAERPDRQGELPSMLVMGDVDFDADVTAPLKVASTEPKWVRKREKGRPFEWRELPGTRLELDSIKATFGRALPKAKFEELRRGAATEFALRENMPKYEFVHLATHGFFAPPIPEFGKAGLTMMSDDRLRTAGPNPALMSGIVCAGVNKPKPNVNGVLTALEIGDMDLRKVELAVLSACETGLGEIAGGEGVLGLQRAFQLAGARTTVTSLWSVSDEGTARLMSLFYANYFRDADENPMGTLESLRQAQLKMLSEGDRSGLVPPGEAKGKGRTPPKYWAAFVLSGDWR
jgi:CHAT domain-containing protein